MSANPARLETVSPGLSFPTHADTAPGRSKRATGANACDVDRPGRRSYRPAMTRETRAAVAAVLRARTVPRKRNELADAIATAIAHGDDATADALIHVEEATRTETEIDAELNRLE